MKKTNMILQLLSLIKKRKAWNKINAYIKKRGYTWTKEKLKEHYQKYYLNNCYCSGTLNELIALFSDEFDLLFNNTNKDKIYQYLTRTFPEIYNFDFYGAVYLCGGAIKNIILNEPVKDLDFVILDLMLDSQTKNNHDIYKFAKTNEFFTKENSFGDVKIISGPPLSVDMWHIKKFEDAMEFNTDGLFYNIKENTLISIGFIKALSSYDLEIINEPPDSISSDIRRDIRRINAFSLLNDNKKKKALLDYLKKEGCKDVKKF